MMGRGFYSPLHSMWGTAFGAAAAAKQYPTFAASSSTANYPPSSPRKDSPSLQTTEEYPMTSTTTNNNNNGDHMEFKPPPPSDQLMGLSYGMTSSSSRKMPEGTSASGSSGNSTAAPYPYYSSPELTAASMYGAVSHCSPFAAAAAANAGRSNFQGATRPKAKARSNAGKKV